MTLPTPPKKKDYNVFAEKNLSLTSCVLSSISNFITLK